MIRFFVPRTYKVSFKLRSFLVLSYKIPRKTEKIMKFLIELCKMASPGWSRGNARSSNNNLQKCLQEIFLGELTKRILEICYGYLLSYGSKLCSKKKAWGHFYPHPLGCMSVTRAGSRHLAALGRTTCWLPYPYNYDISMSVTWRENLFSFFYFCFFRGFYISIDITYNL